MLKAATRDDDRKVLVVTLLALTWSLPKSTIVRSSNANVIKRVESVCNARCIKSIINRTRKGTSTELATSTGDLAAIVGFGRRDQSCALIIRCSIQHECLMLSKEIHLRDTW